MPASSDPSSRSSQRRVAIVTPSLAGQGAERKALYIAAGLLERGHGVDLLLHRMLCHYPEEVPDGVRIFFVSGRADERTRAALDRVPVIPRPLVPDPLPRRVRYPRLAAAGRLPRRQLALLASSRLPRWAASIAGYMDRERPRALLAMNVLATAAAAMASNLARQETRTVATLHEPLRRRQLDRARRSYPWADAVVGVSRGVTGEFAKIPGLASGSVHTVYNPIFAEFIARKSLEPVDHRWLDQTGTPLVVAIGKLIERKGFSTLLHAFARLLARRRARMIVLGEGRLRSSLVSLADRLGVARQVDFPGFVENPYAFLAKADLFVLSSRNEALPTALIEAMVCGCPVVSTDCDFGPREILEGGRHGPLVPVGDPDALAAAMLAVLDTPQRHEALRDRAGFFDAVRAVDRYEELLLGPAGAAARRA